MVSIAPSRGTTLRVRVQPKASGNETLGFREEILRLRVTAPPEDGKANAAVVHLLAKTLGLSRNQLEIIQGHSSRNKLIRIASLNVHDIRHRLSLDN